MNEDTHKSTASVLTSCALVHWICCRADDMPVLWPDLAWHPCLKHPRSLNLNVCLQGHRSNALINLAGGMQTADVMPMKAGDYQLQCRTAEHVEGGMLAIFHVEDSGTFKDSA